MDEGAIGRMIIPRGLSGGCPLFYRNYFTENCSLGNAFFYSRPSILVLPHT